MTALTIYRPQSTGESDFVSFWECQYNDPLERLYTNNIHQPFTRASVHQLFKWKNGSDLSIRKSLSVERNYVACIAEVNAFPRDSDGEEFLSAFPRGGAIWRIFWLHCWQPDRFPIYDQHVHRAMSFIELQQFEEIPKRDTEKVRQYLNRYVPFHRRFCEINQRSVDKALWVYGKFIKTNRFPIPLT